jgi:hypothetical protein
MAFLSAMAEDECLPVPDRGTVHPMYNGRCLREPMRFWSVTVMAAPPNPSSRHRMSPKAVIIW